MKGDIKMTAKLLKGTEIRDEILNEIEKEVKKIKAEYGVVPGLVTILVGEDPASVSYVTTKIKTANRLGLGEAPWPDRQVQQGRFHPRHPCTASASQTY